MVEIERDWVCGRRGQDRVDIGDEAVVRNALVVERRQHQRHGKADVGRVLGQRDCVTDRRGPGTDHAPPEREVGLSA